LYVHKDGVKKRREKERGPVGRILGKTTTRNLKGYERRK
jgi:hypothetical protein